MTENPSAGANLANTPPASTAGTPADTGTTGNPADAAPVESNPTDSSSVSDSEGVQSLAAQEEDDNLQTSPEVDQEGADTEQEQVDSAADVEAALGRETQDGPGDLSAVGENEVERNLEDE